MARLSRARWVPGSGLVAVLVVGAAAVLPYLSTLGGYFLGDDFGLIRLLSPKPPLHFLTLFAAPWTETLYGDPADELRPLLALSYQLDARWGAAWPVGYHATSIALHALNALLVAALARGAARVSVPAAAFAGALFAVLPIHAETVAWISGRADSVPTLFYLSSLLAYAWWRRTGTAWLYCCSLGVYLLAVFSKQSTITMVATLVMFDVLVERRRLLPCWPAVRPYLPFAALTAGYLVLRYVLFGNAIREPTVGAGTFLSFDRVQALHLELLAFGAEVLPRGRFFTRAINAAAAAAVALALLAVWGDLRAARSGGSHRIRGRSLYFGPGWWLVSTAPLLVTYTSPRHLYLASAGVAVAVGVALDAWWGARRRPWRAVGVLGAGGLIFAYVHQSGLAVAEWNASAAVSQRIGADVEHQAGAVASGSLLVLGAPARRAAAGRVTWVWGYALPYALQPPFTSPGVLRRVFVVAPPRLWCCAEGPDGTLRAWWLEETRRAIRAWSEQPEARPVVALLWDPRTGALVRRSDAESPSLRGQVLGLAGAETAGELCTRLRAILGSVGDRVDASC
jgi:hypothetical protein